MEGHYLRQAGNGLLTLLSRWSQRDRPWSCRRLPSRPGQQLRGRELHRGPLLRGVLRLAAWVIRPQLLWQLLLMLWLLAVRLLMHRTVHALLWRS